MVLCYQLKKDFILENFREGVMGLKKKFLRKIKTKTVIEPKKINQKKMDIIFIGGLIGFGLIAFLCVILSFSHLVGSKSVKQEVKEIQVSTIEKNNWLDDFLSGYVSEYFNVPSDSNSLLAREDKLKSYYNFEPQIKTSNTDKVESHLIDSKLEEVKDNQATYKVTYETGSDDNKSKVTVQFVVPFVEENGLYYVSGLPHFEAIPSLKNGNVSEGSKLNLNGTDKFTESQRKELNDFINLFFTNYTTSQQNLDVISNGVVAITGVTYKSLDYSFYKNDGKKIKAYIQASFDVLGTVHSENFTFTITTKNGSMYVEDLEHEIPSNYMN